MLKEVDGVLFNFLSRNNYDFFNKNEIYVFSRSPDDLIVEIKKSLATELIRKPFANFEVYPKNTRSFSIDELTFLPVGVFSSEMGRCFVFTSSETKKIFICHKTKETVSLLETNVYPQKEFKTFEVSEDVLKILSLIDQKTYVGFFSDDVPNGDVIFNFGGITIHQKNKANCVLSEDLPIFHFRKKQIEKEYFFDLNGNINKSFRGPTKRIKRNIVAVNYIRNNCEGGFSFQSYSDGKDFFISCRIGEYNKNLCSFNFHSLF